MKIQTGAPLCRIYNHSIFFSTIALYTCHTHYAVPLYSSRCCNQHRYATTCISAITALTLEYCLRETPCALAWRLKIVGISSPLSGQYAPNAHYKPPGWTIFSAYGFVIFRIRWRSGGNITPARITKMDKSGCIAIVVIADQTGSRWR